MLWIAVTRAHRVATFASVTAVVSGAAAKAVTRRLSQISCARHTVAARGVSLMVVRAARRAVASVVRTVEVNAACPTVVRRVRSVATTARFTVDPVCARRRAACGTTAVEACVLPTVEANAAL